MKQETLEEVAERLYPTTIDSFTDSGIDLSERDRIIFTDGAKYQQEQDKNKYSEEDMLKFAQKYAVNTLDKSHIEQFKKK